MHSMLVCVTRREDVLFHRVDIDLDQIGDVEVVVDDVVGDRVHDRVGAELEQRGGGFEFPPHPCQPAVLAVPDRHHEVGADEHHDLAGLDDLPGLGHRLVLDVVHRLEDHEQRLVVALQLGPLMGVHRVLDGQFVQAEHVADGLHLVFVGFVQADPHERVPALGFEFVHLVQRSGVGVLAGQPLAVDVDGAVDHGPRDGHVDGLGLGVVVPVLGPWPAEGREAERPGTKASHTTSRRSAGPIRPRTMLRAGGCGPPVSRCRRCASFDPVSTTEIPLHPKEPEDVSTSPLKVAVTGAAGQIGYSLLFRLASGSLLGPDRPIELRLLEIEPALKALEGVVMELDDCAFPLLSGVEIGADANKIFDGVNLALLVGARPRGPGMERGDLLEANGAIFTAQGKALNSVAADDVRIGVTGNPANTNALIAMTNAPDIPQERFSALTRLDHNRAISQLARKTGAKVTDIKKMTIWGNHSATQYPDVFHAEVGGKNAAEVVNDQDWIENDFIPTVAKRGAAIIDARGASSAASAASATVDAARSWLLGSPKDDWVSMAVVSDGSYDVPEGLISSFPVTTKDGNWSIVGGLEIDDFSRSRIDKSTAELADERKAVKELGLI